MCVVVEHIVHGAEAHRHGGVLGVELLFGVGQWRGELDGGTS
uniref:Uncharacterized protein n=1 Tax=Arundo donax TaxID=35708 RepID=A0A0A9EKA7_ARUDO